MTTFAKKKYKEFGNKFGLSVFILFFSRSISSKLYAA